MSSVEHVRTFSLPVPVEQLFPLFSPQGEKDWVPGWDYTSVEESIDLFEDYVFLTSSHDHGTADAVWMVKRYQPENHRVEFYKVEPGEKVGRVKVVCRSTRENETEVEVSYRYTALSDSGRVFVSGFDEASYAAFIGEWKKLLCSHFGLDER